MSRDNRRDSPTVGRGRRDRGVHKSSRRVIDAIQLGVDAVERAIGGTLPESVAAVIREQLTRMIDIGRELEAMSTLEQRQRAERAEEVSSRLRARIDRMLRRSKRTDPRRE